MDRVDLDNVWQPLGPLAWPGGQEIYVKPIVGRQQRIATKIEKGELDPFDHLPQLVAELVIPAKTAEQVENEVDLERMWVVVHLANRNVELVEQYLALHDHFGRTTTTMRRLKAIRREAVARRAAATATTAPTNEEA